MEYFIRAIQMSFDFQGRDTRTEFWMFYLFATIFNIILIFIYEPLSDIFSLFLIPATISIGLRRFHDVGYGGNLYFLLYITAFVTSIVFFLAWSISLDGLFIFALLACLGSTITLFLIWVRDSQDGENKYGPNPKEIGQKEEITQEKEENNS